MPSWYVHIQAAAETMETLKAGVPAGSPLSQQEANDLFDAAHTHRNYLAAGAIGPDLFFVLPDFKGDAGKGLLALVDFVFKTWKVLDDEFVSKWEQWMAPVMDNTNQLANGLTGGMLGEVGQIFNALTGSLNNFVLGMLAQMQDVFGLMSSGTQTGYGDSAFFWSDMFHYRKTYQFARRLYANALHADDGLPKKPTNEPSRVPKQQAFALGWMSHCATDVAAHPFTNAKCGGPYRTHWQRHHVIENHMDGLIYGMRHAPMTNYDSLDTAALQFRLAFGKGAPMPDPAMPDDVPSWDYFPSSWAYPPYTEGEKAADYAARKTTFDVDTEPFPEHLCELLLKTMKEVYTDPDDMQGPQVLRWDPGKHIDDGGRPTVAVLQDMFHFAFEYAKYNSSSGLGPRPPRPPDVITDFDLPRPPGGPMGGGAPDLTNAKPLSFVDLLLAILAWAIYILELITWLLTLPIVILTSLATYPLRELLYQLLVVPTWDLYMKCRLALVMEGFLSPKPSEVSMGLVTLGLDEKGAMAQLRADLASPSGFATNVEIDESMPEPSGLDATRGAATGGYSLDPAYPRAMVTDLNPPWFNKAPVDSPQVYSEFVAPWRYPDHNLAGMRNGWEAPRTHVGPYQRPDDAKVLMGGMPGSDAARRRFEDAGTPEETEAVSAELMPEDGAHLGDPIDYGAYLIGKLTGNWATVGGTDAYVAHDDPHPLPDFNLDSDRGYAYQCWDYLRHVPSAPPSPPDPVDALKPTRAEVSPDQWLCMPQIQSILSELTGTPPLTIATNIRDWYGYPEPCTVPQRYDPADNPHHRSRYDPLKRLAHYYLPRTGQPPTTPPGTGCTYIDLEVSEAEMLAVRMSPTGRRVP